jgi:NAD(P)-dependent dehydrogenase (short-subunit alcohol dehydrogenase family)
MSTLTDQAPARNALVTGGARRIGRSIALALADAGFSVIVHSRHHDADAAALVMEIVARGARAALVSADLANDAECAGLIARAAAHGPVDLLVNNASVFEDDAVGTLNSAQWDRQFIINLKAPVFLAQAFAAQARDGASIINITDQRARKPVPRHFSYSLTKSALEDATIMLAQALAPRVRVNAVAPGPTLPSPRQDPAAFRAQAAVLPLGRGPSPQDIAAAVLYLAAATSVTGETIAVDGGQHVAWRTPDAWGIDE